MCWSQGSYARCEVDPGDRDCNNFDWVLNPIEVSGDKKSISGDEVVLIESSGVK